MLAGRPDGGASPGRVHVGCSGWQYKDWRGRVYPQAAPQRSWFAHYATLMERAG